MPKVVEEIPLELRPAAEAALDWINRSRGTRFKLTGLVTPDHALDWDANRPIELGLVLCDGDQCLREDVRVLAQGRGFEFTAIEADQARIPPHLDPPVGVRSTWLDEQLARHALVLMVFYRGFW
jgi:hypothetical protein